MRRAMFNEVERIVRSDENAVLMLADIGALAFSDLINDIPERAMNIGIFEAGMVSVAAGMAIKGMFPIIYGITPFIAERALEQIKLNFAYQSLDGIFITTGAAYDFSTLGYSHYSPADATYMKQLVDVQFIAPGTPKQIESLLQQTYRNGKPTFFRMSDYCNKYDCVVEAEKATIIRTGKKATVIAVSTMLDLVMNTFADEDVTILYYTTLAPFDKDTLRNNCPSKKVLVCEPEYENTLTHDIISALHPGQVQIDWVGVPLQIIRTYGTKREKDELFGFNEETLRRKLHNMIDRPVE